MPELPEVESLRRGLVRAELVSPVFSVWRSDFHLRTGTHWRAENLQHLRGTVPLRWSRHGKHLVWGLRGQRQDIGLLIHLGMSGKLVIAEPHTPRAIHTHVVIGLEDGRELRYVDPRRFGGMKAAPWDTLWSSPPLSELGPDALDPAFSGAYLENRAGQSQRCVRDVLLDQRVVAGIGNIYALEALFRARLHPLLSARRLRRSAWDRLRGEVVEVLVQGIRNGGTTFRDYRGAQDETGRNQHTLAVYGRGGQPCRVCGAALEAFVLGGRSGVYCPEHQRRPRGRSVP